MRSLYGKFIIITIGIMMTSSVVSFLLLNTYYQQKLKPENDQKNTGVALEIVSFIESHPQLNLEEYLENLSAIGYQLVLVQDNGIESFFGAPFRDNTLPIATRNYVLEGNIYHGILHFPQETFVTGFFANELSNTVGVPFTFNGHKYALFLRPDINFLFHEMRVLLGWLLILTILLSILIVFLSANYFVKPISKLTKATKRLSHGDFQVNLDINRRDELGELAQSFSRMAKKLEQMEDMRKEFISNISHDIQSPLSNIKGYIHLLKKDSLKDEEKGQYMDIINTEIQRLSTLTKQFILLASLDRNQDLLKKSHFNLSQQLKELIRSYQWLISERGIMLSYSLPDVHIYGDPSLLNTVWDNLLTNGIKYNKPNGAMEISIESIENGVRVAFVDKGIGLSETEIERIFDRFYRADSSRSRTMEGTGLGLSIVNTIVKLHEGQIHVNSIEGEGTSFIIELPADKKMDKQPI